MYVCISLSWLVCGMCDHFHRTFHIPATKEIYVYFYVCVCVCVCTYMCVCNMYCVCI